MLESRHTLGPNERLKSRKHIALLFSNGDRINIKNLRASYRRHTLDAGYLRAGFGVSARNFKRAVDRNRIRRQMREAWRLQHTGLRSMVAAWPDSLDVFLIYTGREIPVYAEIFELVAVVIHKLNTRFNHEVR